MRTFSKIAITAVAASIALAAPASIASANPLAEISTGSLGSLSNLFPGLGGTTDPDPAESCETVGDATGTPVVTPERRACLDAAGETITVTGEGFSGEGAGIYVGLVQDSLHSETNADAWFETKFVRAAQIADGKWTATLDVQAVFGADALAANCLENACSIYTMAAHGSADRTQDTKTPVTFEAK